MLGRGTRPQGTHAKGVEAMPGRSALRRLSRQDLLELLVEAAEENDRLSAENARLTDELVRLGQSGRRSVQAGPPAVPDPTASDTRPMGRPRHARPAGGEAK